MNGVAIVVDVRVRVYVSLRESFATTVCSL